MFQSSGGSRISFGARPFTKMRPQSAKAKGRRLQQWAAEELKRVFPHLVGNDVRSLPMGAPGDDLILSTAALAALPYNFEMKNVESLSMWATLAQAAARRDPESATLPCLVVKRNHIKPVAIVPLGHYCDMLRAAIAVPGTAVPCVPPEVSVQEALALFQLPCTALSTAAKLQMVVTMLFSFALQGKRHVSASPGAAGIANPPIGPERYMCHSAATLNLWRVWADAPGAVVFNRGDDDAPIYVAVSFGDFTAGALARWRAKSIE